MFIINDIAIHCKIQNCYIGCCVGGSSDMVVWKDKTVRGFALFSRCVGGTGACLVSCWLQFPLQLFFSFFLSFFLFLFILFFLTCCLTVVLCVFSALFTWAYIFTCFLFVLSLHLFPSVNFYRVLLLNYVFLSFDFFVLCFFSFVTSCFCIFLFLSSHLLVSILFSPILFLSFWFTSAYPLFFFLLSFCFQFNFSSSSIQ